MAEDNRLFKTEKDVFDYFIQLNKTRNDFPESNLRIERLLKRGIMIDTKLRRDILTGKNEGKITLNGVVEDYMFKSMAGGVYKCYVSDRRAFNTVRNLSATDYANGEDIVITTPAGKITILAEDLKCLG
jgi:hypothetical protein